MTIKAILNITRNSQLVTFAIAANKMAPRDSPPSLFPHSSRFFTMLYFGILRTTRQKLFLKGFFHRFLELGKNIFFTNSLASIALNIGLNIGLNILAIMLDFCGNYGGCICIRGVTFFVAIARFAIS